jgi:hypothetical protein
MRNISRHIFPRNLNSLHQISLSTFAAKAVTARPAGSVTVQDLEISDSTPDNIVGWAIIEFTEYDPNHFSDGRRKARLDFVFEWETAILVVRCRDARREISPV